MTIRFGCYAVIVFIFELSIRLPTVYSLDCYECDTGVADSTECEGLGLDNIAGRAPSTCAQDGWGFVDRLNRSLTIWTSRITAARLPQSVGHIKPPAPDVPGRSIELEQRAPYCYTVLESEFACDVRGDNCVSTLKPGESFVQRGCLTETGDHLRVILKGAMGFNVYDNESLTGCFEAFDVNCIDETPAYQQRICLCTTHMCNVELGNTWQGSRLKRCRSIAHQNEARFGNGDFMWIFVFITFTNGLISFA